MQNGRNIQTILIVVATRNVTHCDNLEFGFVHILGGMRSNITKALDGHRDVLRPPAQPTQHFKCQDPHASARCLFSTLGPVIFYRLPRDTGRVKAIVFFPLISHPRHRR